MTLSEIYNRAMFLVYGDSTPPAALTTQAQAVAEGLIARVSGIRTTGSVASMTVAPQSTMVLSLNK